MGPCWPTTAWRVVFTAGALPAIRPVNHLIDNRETIIRTHLGGAITDAVGGAAGVAAYEADQIDPRQRLGWSVVVTGRLNPVAEPAHGRHHPHPPKIVTGFRLTQTA